MDHVNPVKLIQEVKKRPGLYSSEHPTDREEKLGLWKEIGAELYENWSTYSKATAYDRVLQLQKKWRSLRDAYSRELRSRKTGVRVNARVYMYFKRMSFLGGFEGTLSEEDEGETESADPLVKKQKPRAKKRKVPKSSTESESVRSDHIPDEMEIPIYPVSIADEPDSDKLFLLSFLPEMRQLPPNIKMWARAQIANVMQEAVGCQYNNTVPGSCDDVKRQGKEF